MSNDNKADKNTTNGSENEIDYPFNNMLDKPTIVTHLGFRFFYTFVAGIILVHNITPGQGFFTSLILFNSALFMDYFKFIPRTRKRIWLKRIGIFSSGLGILISILGLTGILTIIQIDNNNSIEIARNFIVLKGKQFDVVFVWYGMLISVVLTVLDWIVYEVPEENIISSNMNTKRRQLS